MKTFTIDNFQCKLGKNALENWKLLSESQPDDLLFHLSYYPSGYLIMECNKKYPRNIVLEEAAFICKENTKYRNIKNIKVDCTTCSNTQKGESIGEIIFKYNSQVFQIVV